MLASVLGAFALGCAGRPSVTTTTTAPVWTFEVQGSFTTTGERDGEPLEALAPYAQMESALRGSVARYRVRRFSDDSIGWVLRFGPVEQADSPEGPWTRSELSGKSLELRGFETGEILQLRNAAHISGPGRHGETLDALFFAISPVVPDLEAGASGWRRQTWPFEVARQRNLHTNLQAEWTGLERNFEHATLSYQGKLDGRGMDTPVGARMSVGGTASGEVSVNVADATVLRHQVDWERELRLDYDSGAWIEQIQHLTVQVHESEPAPGQALPVDTELYRRGTAETDAQNLPLYIEPDEIHATLSEQLARFEQCYTFSSARGRTQVGVVKVTFFIAPDGNAQGAYIEESKSTLPDLDECLVDQANTLVFRPHDEEPIGVGYPFVFRDGALQPYPMVAVKQRPMGLLWLHLPASSGLEGPLLRD
ncbi:MAG: AgmX/PglI C-terminal domain-containing protein [Myxococcota bacterium]|nr:AgmX/PglI C-terminal domain-containing protein [Myxococcota bacterium]